MCLLWSCVVITYWDDVERGLFEENAKHLTSSAALVEISNSSNVTAGTSFVELLREKFPRRETRRRQKKGNCFRVYNKRITRWWFFDLLVKLQNFVSLTYFLCQQSKVPKKLPSGRFVFDICIAHHRQNNSLRFTTFKQILPLMSVALTTIKILRNGRDLAYRRICVLIAFSFIFLIKI